MKRITIILLTLLFIGTIGISVYAQTDSLNGYEFNILAVDTSITPESGLILTSASALSSSGVSWSILIHCGKTAENIYSVKEDAIIPTGTIPSITFSTGDIVIAIHSSTSNPDLATSYPNVNQKINAMKVKTGMYFTLKNIDLTAKTATNGKAVLSLTNPGTGNKDYNDIMGDLVADPQYKLDVTAPQTYKPGDTLNVTITLKNVVPASGLSLVHYYLYYDMDKVDPVVKNDGALNAEMEKFLVTAPSRSLWEGISKLDETQGRYDISFATASNSAAAKVDGSLVMVVPFKVKSTAKGTIASQVPHKMTEALDNNMNKVYGNGGIALSVLSAATSSSVTSSKAVKTGDTGSSQVIIISIVIIAGISAALGARFRRRR